MINSSVKQLKQVYVSTNVNERLFRVAKESYQFISTGLSIDRVYINDMNEWRDKYDEFIQKQLKQVYVSCNVVDAVKKRMEFIFDELKNIIVSISGGKDSTVRCWLALQEARKRNRKIGIFFLMKRSCMNQRSNKSLWLMNLYPENTRRDLVSVSFSFNECNKLSRRTIDLLGTPASINYGCALKYRIPFKHIPWDREKKQLEIKIKVLIL